MAHESFQYHIIVIRLWPETSGLAFPRWRFTLESPSSRERLGFTELRALLDQVEVDLTTLTNEAAPAEQHVNDEDPHDSK